MKKTVEFKLSIKRDGVGVITRDGANWEQSIPGVVLEAQFMMKNHNFLILTSEDCPYEEALHIILMDELGSIIDKVEIGQEATPGIVKDIETLDDSRIKFKFIGDGYFTVDVLETPEIMPFDSLKYSYIKHGNPLRKKNLLVRFHEDNK